MSFVQLSDAGDALDHLLSPLPPLVVKHTVRCDGPSPSITACYDLDVEMPAAQPGERVVHLLDKVWIEHVGLHPCVCMGCIGAGLRMGATAYACVSVDGGAAAPASGL
eukprot:363790-Chlamydomonas_euryale.AAC.16